MPAPVSRTTSVASAVSSRQVMSTLTHTVSPGAVASTALLTRFITTWANFLRCNDTSGRARKISA